MALFILFPLAVILFICLFVFLIYKNKQFTKNMSPEEKEEYYKKQRERVHGESSDDSHNTSSSTQKMTNLGYYD